MTEGPNHLGQGTDKLLVLTSLDLSRDDGPRDHFMHVLASLAPGHRTTLLYPRVPTARAPEFPAGITLSPFPRGRSFGVPNALASLLALPKIASNARNAIVYIRNAPGSMPLVKAARRAGAKRIVIEHNGWLEDDLSAFGYSSALSRFARWSQVEESKAADANRTVTENLASLLRENGVPASKLHVIGNGTDTRAFHPLERLQCLSALGLPTDGVPTVGYLGNLWPGSGLEDALIAAKALRDQGLQLQLLIGGDGPSRGALESMATSLLGIGAAHFFGSVPSARGNLILGAADIAIAPYRRKRNERVGVSSLKLRAYAAAGKVVVTSNLPGIRELGSEAWIAMHEPDDPVSLARALRHALQLPRTHGIAARTYACENFDWSVIGKQVRDLLTS